MKPIKRQFVVERATKNTWKYQERPEEGQPLAIGSLYIQKWATGSEPPNTVTVTVEEG